MNQDIEFLKNSMQWPRWPMCPVRRRDGDSTNQFCTGVVLSFAGPPRVYKLNVFNLPKVDTWAEALEGVEFKEYPTLEDLVVEWSVD